MAIRLQLPMAVNQTFISLRNPNYRLWFMGMIVSLMGIWMQNTAQGYLVFELTKSPAFLGYVSFISGLPSWFFILFAGVIADRIPRRTMLLVTQSTMMVLAFTLATLVFLDIVEPWHILVLAFLLGSANAFDAPARQAFVVELVPREDLTNAIALNSSLFNIATLIGPSIGGIVYAAFGPGWCFFINGMAFPAIILAIWLIKLTPNLKPNKVRSSALIDLQVGLDYIRTNKIVWTLILSSAVMSILGMGLMSLMPAWAVNVLKGDVQTNGLLLSARGGGALLGALMIAAIGAVRGRGRWVMLGFVVLPLAMLLFSLLNSLPLALLFLFIMGWGAMTSSNITNALLQMFVPNELRGRVMSVFSLTFFGGMPLGALVISQAADVMGEQLAVMIFALILLLYAMVMWFKMPFIRKLE